MKTNKLELNWTSTSNVLDFILFADDTTILYSYENFESQISVMLN